MHGISASIPFVFALVRYSAGGKIYTFDVLFDSILKYLLEVEVTVLEVLTTHKFPKSFPNKQGLGEQIRNMGEQRPTPTNAISSGSYFVMMFESVIRDRKYGNIAGDEESTDNAKHSPGDILASSELARKNTDFQALIQEMVSENGPRTGGAFGRSS